MANSYFNYQNPVQPGDRVESNKYNNDFGSIEKAFDTLPSPEKLATNNSNYAVTTGTVNQYRVDLPQFDPAFGLLDGMQVIMKMHLTNTGPSTLSLNGRPPVRLINMLTGTAPYELVAGDLAKDAIYELRYDGAAFQVSNTVDNAVKTLAQAAQEAQTAAGQAAVSKTSASTDAGRATSAASSASTSETNAAGAESAAESAKTLAQQADSNAAGSASSAATSATNAGNSASAAATSETNTKAYRDSTASWAAAASQSYNSANQLYPQMQQLAAQAAASAQQAEAVLTSSAFTQAVLNVLYTNSVRVGAVKFYAANLNPATLFPGTTWVRLDAERAIRTANSTGSNVLTTSGSDNVTLTTANLPAHSHTATVTINNYSYAQQQTSTFNFGTVSSDAATITGGNASTYNFPATATQAGGGATVNTSLSGGHSHGIAVTGGSGTTGNILGGSSAAAADQYTASGGDHTHSATFAPHTHTITVAPHSHTFTMGPHTHKLTVPDHKHDVTMPPHNHTVTPSISNSGNGMQFSIKNASIYLAGWRRTA